MGKKTNFVESLALNNQTYGQYLSLFTELAISQIGYEGLPDTVDPRYLELELFINGSAVYFEDDVTGDHLALSLLPSGNFDVYGNPVSRRAYSRYNNYQAELNRSNSVIIWNNMLHTGSAMDAMLYARRMYTLDRVIDVNANAQKTPVLVRATEQQRLTLKNVYKEYDGNSPVIFADKDLDPNSLRVLTTGAPYVADKLYQLKTQYWNEALTRLGISNVNTQKKERLISDEVSRTQGGTIASRFSRLESRKQAIDKINQMFGLNIKVFFREDTEVPEMPGVRQEEGGDK